MEENEIDLVEYLKVVWKWKRLIILGTLALGIIAVIISLCLPKIYRASVIFLVTASPVVSGSEGVLQTPYEILLETYSGVIKNKSCLTAVLKKFKLDQKPYKFKLEKLEKLVSVKSVQNSKLIRLDVDLKDPQLATDIANFIASNAVELNLKLSHGDTVEAQRFLNDEADKAKQELISSEKEFLDFQKEARMNDLRKRNETLFALKSSLSQSLTDTEIKLSSEVGKMKKLEEELKIRSPKISLNKSLTDDPAYQQLLASITTSQQKDFLGLSLTSEAINEAYGKMDQDLVTSLAQVGLLQSQKKATIDSLAGIAQELKATQITLAQQGMIETNLNNRYMLAISVYQDFRKKLGEANINVVATSQDLKILDPAVVPSQPLTRKRLVIIIVTFLVGGIGFTFLAFLLEYFQKIKEGENTVASHALKK